MSRSSSALALALALVSLALAGCIAPPETLDAAATEGADASVDATGTSATFHRAPLSPDDLADVLNATDGESLLGGVPVPVGTVRASPLRSFEPTLGVDADGVVYLSTFVTGAPSYTLLQRSLDQGLTWEDVTPRVGPVSVPPQSNDPYVHVDVDTGRVFLSDLQALVCSTLSFSDDQGESWTTNPIGCGQPFGVHDHQTVFTAKPRTVETVGYENVVYYCINRVADSACATSLNGGLTFGALRPLVYSGVAPEDCVVAGGLHAHGAAAPDGTVYLPKGHCGKATVAITKDDGLTWDTVVISESVPSPGHEVNFAIDEAGNAYASWLSDDNLPYLAVSIDGGYTWGEPFLVSAPDVGTAAFAALAAGSDGRVAIAYYGTTAAKEYGDMEAEDTWNGYLTVLTDATSERPTLMTVAVNDPTDPLARGICGGGRCNGVGDFIDLVIDSEGRPWGAFVDVCNDACARSNGKANEGAIGVVGTLAAGPTLRGELAALPALVSTPAE